ncbi:MAG: hypothetical protein V5A25_13475 [Halovenus sp.]
MTPLFVHADALGPFEDLACWRLEPAHALDDEDLLRHMRTAGYGMLDFLEETAGEGRRAVADDDIEPALEERAERAREDGEDRFW